MKSLLCAALLVLAACAAAAMSTTTQSFVVIGDAAIAESLAASPTLAAPAILMELDSSSDEAADIAAELEAAVASPELVLENQRIDEDAKLLSSMELLAHQLGAPVLSDLQADKAEHEVISIERSLLGVKAQAEADAEAEGETLDASLPRALLETAPAEPAAQATSETEEMEAELAMVEVAAEVAPAKSASPARHHRAALAKANDYAFLDDPKDGGAPTVLRNLQGLDIYVVNTPMADNDNEIRPVAPPHPMSASMRLRAKQAAAMRKQLIHDIPEPKAHIHPHHRINTLSAYEPSLMDSRPLSKLSRLSSVHLDEPLVGGMGAQQLKGIVPKGAPTPHSFMEMALPGTAALPAFPRREPAAANAAATPAVTITVGKGSSFDNRDGPPVMLDDLLPLKAQLVEELEPLGMSAVPAPSEPNGW